MIDDRYKRHWTMRQASGPKQKKKPQDIRCSNLWRKNHLTRRPSTTKVRSFAANGGALLILVLVCRPAPVREAPKSELGGSAAIRPHQGLQSSHAVRKAVRDPILSTHMQR